MLRKILIGTTLLLILILGYFAIKELVQRSRISRMKKEELTRLATEYARQQGWKVDDYSIATVSFEEGKCWIAFQGKSGLPGDHFSVLLDAETGQVLNLIPGR